MASLDFAFLAEFAKIEATATITSVGAGIKGIGVLPDPGSIQIYVAGGVSRDLGEGEATLTMTLEAPNAEYSLSRSETMSPAPTRGDFSSTVFAIALEVPIVGYGKYQVQVAINDEVAQTLPLWIALAPSDRAAGA
jgi:hypothetical protein